MPFPEAARFYNPPPRRVIYDQVLPLIMPDETDQGWRDRLTNTLKTIVVGPITVEEFTLANFLEDLRRQAANGYIDPLQLPLVKEAFFDTHQKGDSGTIIIKHGLGSVEDFLKEQDYPVFLRRIGPNLGRVKIHEPITFDVPRPENSH